MMVVLESRKRASNVFVRYEINFEAPELYCDVSAPSNSSAIQPPSSILSSALSKLPTKSII
jgi:hypothetical protein